jgi:hypothetical protein
MKIHPKSDQEGAPPLHFHPPVAEAVFGDFNSHIPAAFSHLPHEHHLLHLELETVTKSESNYYQQLEVSCCQCEVRQNSQELLPAALS